MNLGTMIPAIGTEGLATNGAVAPAVATPVVKTGLGAGAVTGIAVGSAVSAGVGMFFLGKHVGAKKERKKWETALEEVNDDDEDDYEYYEEDLKEVKEDSPKSDEATDKK